MDTHLEIFKQIYLKPGIHIRALSRELDLGMPSIKYGLDKLKSQKLLISETEGRNIKLYVNFSVPIVIPYIYMTEYSRLAELPVKIQYAIADLLKILEKKPVISVIFGSYVSKTYNNTSDLDLLLVFNNLEEDIESKSRLISSRHNVSIQPVYLTWEEFKTRYCDLSDKFMKNIKRSKIIVTGIEWWVHLENETT